MVSRLGWSRSNTSKMISGLWYYGSSLNKTQMVEVSFFPVDFVVCRLVSSFLESPSQRPFVLMLLLILIHILGIYAIGNLPFLSLGGLNIKRVRPQLQHTEKIYDR